MRAAHRPAESRVSPEPEELPRPEARRVKHFHRARHHTVGVAHRPPALARADELDLQPAPDLAGQAAQFEHCDHLTIVGVLLDAVRIDLRIEY